MLKKIWLDEGGATLSAEVALIGTILVIGVVVGLSALQDAVNAELADLGQAVSSLDQSYTSNTVTGHGGATSNGSDFADVADFCDDDTGTGLNERCITVAAAGADDAD